MVPQTSLFPGAVKLESHSYEDNSFFLSQVVTNQFLVCLQILEILSCFILCMNLK